MIIPVVRGWIRRAIRGLGGERFLYPRRAADVPWNQRQWGIAIYAGPSPLQLSPVPGAAIPVLTHADVTDVDAAVVADPFLVSTGPDAHWLFFEVYDRATGRGAIAVAGSTDLRQWKYHRVVLAEAFHMSFPCVFEWNGDYFLVPESYQAGAVHLYRATSFPYEWTRVATLVSGPYLVDASICRHADAWWLFVETNPARTNDTLRLYRSEALEGPWIEHPASPVVQGDAGAARPAGRVVRWEGRLLRFAQDCRGSYGTGVCAFEILEMTATTYRERPAARRPMLSGAGSGWNRFGMHHVDAHPAAGDTWVAAVDGWTVRRSPERT